jgi:hypothetical protein
VDNDNRPPDKEFIDYINGGFSIIEQEFAGFEAKIDSMKGSMCPHHEYSEEELMYSSHIKNIKSIVERIGNEIASWEAKKAVSDSIRAYYENKMNALRQKLNYMFTRVKFRKKTAWDNISELVMCSYYFIMNIAFYHFKNFVVPIIMNDSHSRQSPFAMFGHAADLFANFMNDVMGQYTREYDDFQRRA